MTGFTGCRGLLVNLCLVTELSRKYHMYFQRHTVNIADKAFQYLKGLFQADKKNLERIEERISGVSYDPLQYFLSDALAPNKRSDSYRRRQAPGGTGR